jgi:predicted amidophosphoribosyltransferase
VRIDGVLLESCIKCYLHDINNARKICAECGKEFITPVATTKFCCRNCAIQYNKKSAQRKKQPKKQTLDEIIAELNEYNHTHGTHLTYGKYQAMRFKEALKNGNT